MLRTFFWQRVDFFLETQVQKGASQWFAHPSCRILVHNFPQMQQITTYRAYMSLAQAAEILSGVCQRPSSPRGVIAMAIDLVVFQQSIVLAQWPISLLSPSVSWSSVFYRNARSGLSAMIAGRTQDLIWCFK